MAASRYAELSGRRQRLLTELDAIYREVFRSSRDSFACARFRDAYAELYFVEEELRLLEAFAPLRVVPREGERW